VNIQHTTSAAEALVPAPKVDGADTILTQHRSTHDARLDGDIEVRLLECADGHSGQDAGQGDKFGVSGAIESAVRLVHAATDDLAIFDENAAHWCLVTLQRKLSLSLVHESAKFSR
jgi:hypothetical protein